MRLNVQKSHVMWFHVRKRKLKSPHLQISFYGVTLKNTEQQKYLGLIFDYQHRGILRFLMFVKDVILFISN